MHFIISHIKTLQNHGEVILIHLREENIDKIALFQYIRLKADQLYQFVTVLYISEEGI